MVEGAVGKRVSLEDVERVAWLARIRLTEEEKELFTQQFNEILAYFEKLNELDTSTVWPTYHTLNLSNVMREDEVKPSLPTDAALANAPRLVDRYFKSPRIL